MGKCYVKTKWGATYKSSNFILGEDRVLLFKPMRWIIDENGQIIEPATKLNEDVLFTITDIEKIVVFSGDGNGKE